jgi:hypothetical protein
MRSKLASLTVALAVPALACAPRATVSSAPEPAGGRAPLPATTLPLKLAPRPTKPEITAADLMTRLYIFADDSMQGREAGTIGNVKGTDYIAAEIKKLGLLPAGENGTYFQAIPLKTRTLGANPTLSVNGTALTPFVDFVPTAGVPLNGGSIPTIFGGHLGGEAPTITTEQANGKLVVFTLPAGAARLPRGLSLDGAAGIIVIGGESISQQAVAFARRPTTFMDDGSSNARPVITLTSSAAAKLFSAPLAQVKPGDAGATVSANVAYEVKPIEHPARNVIGIIPGSDPNLKGQYVAIGAHNDHVGFNNRPLDHDSVRIWNHIVRPQGADDGGKQATPALQEKVNAELAAFRAKNPGAARQDSIFNGADDDGSGTVTVLEIAEKIASMKVKPKRSMLFVWHVGEEKGLLGSRWFTDNPTVPRDSVVAQLNMDMVGRGGAHDETGRTKDGQAIVGSPNYLQLVGSRRLSTELGDIVESVNKSGGHNMYLDYSIDADGHPSNIYCRSDHYEYARYGIPIVFFTTGLHSDYHQLTDEAQYIDYSHMTRVGKLVNDIAVHVANLDHRVKVDKPKPDPKGGCRQ